MDPELRDTWNAPNWVIDRLVEAVEAGDAAEKIKLARHFIRCRQRLGWNHGTVVGSGIIVLNANLDPAKADPGEIAGALEETVSAARLTKIAAGGRLTKSEALRWREYSIECGLDEEIAWTYGANFWVVLELRHTNRRRAYLALRNWDGRSGVFVAAYETQTYALMAVRSLGVVRVD